MNEPSIRQLRYFIAVANEGQISRAAMELNVSQSAVTTAVKQLETLLGTRLLDRHASGVSLTYDGSIFLDHARRVLTTVDEAVRAPRRRHEDIEGSLRLAMTYTVAGYYIAPHVERFSSAFPGIDLQLREASRIEIEDGLVSGHFDLAVMLTSNIMDQEGLSYQTLLRSQRRLWLSSRHPLLDHSAVSLQDVARQPYIMLTVDEASNTAQRYWNRTSYRPQTIFRTASVEAVRSMVASGMGVTILSDMVYRPWSLDGRRVEVRPLAEAIPTMDVGLAWAANVEPGPAAAAFKDFMRLGHAEGR